MRLADFITSSMEPILVEWEAFACGIANDAAMDSLALRDNAQDILLATVRDMNSAQSADQRTARSRGKGHAEDFDSALNGASELHAIGRLGVGFDLMEVISEYRALRASVLRLWHDSAPAPDDRNVKDLSRFNESIDQSVAKAVNCYTHRVDQARDMFLAILGHDLRNPLNSIAMSAQLLPHTSHPDPDSIEYATQISTNAQVMGRMIGDLLDYTRTRLGVGMPMTPEPMDLGPLASELIKEYQTANPTRELQFHAEGDLHGSWDTDRLRQVISNLLGNSIQHGDVAVPVQLTLRGEAGQVVIVVRNGGVPIPPGEMAKIFDPLVRGSSTGKPARNRPGSIGLGLYIAREIVISHGGRIEVTSTQEEGTAFIIHLPRQRPADLRSTVLGEKKFPTQGS